MLLSIYLIDIGVISLNQSQYSVSENSNFLPVAITLYTTVTEEVIVKVTISDGSANCDVYVSVD